jgi:hypothetical protein
MQIRVPTTALAEVMRNPYRRARLSRLMRQARTDLVVQDGPYAAAAGLLLARTEPCDIVDAHAAICAQS